MSATTENYTSDEAKVVMNAHPYTAQVESWKQIQ